MIFNQEKNTVFFRCFIREGCRESGIYLKREEVMGEGK